MFILLMCFAAIRGMTVTGDSWKRKWGIYSAEHKSYCFLFQGTSRYQRLVWGGGLRGITDVIVIHTTRALCLCRSLLAPVSLFPQKWEDRGCCLLFLKTPLPTRRVLAVKGPCRAPSSAPPAQPSGTRAPRRCVWPGQLPGPRHAGALCSGWWEAEPCVWVLPPPTEGNQYAWVGGLSAEMPRHSYTALAVGSALAALILFWFVGGGGGEEGGGGIHPLWLAGHPSSGFPLWHAAFPWLLRPYLPVQLVVWELHEQWSAEQCCQWSLAMLRLQPQFLTFNHLWSVAPYLRGLSCAHLTHQSLIWVPSFQDTRPWSGLFGLGTIHDLKKAIPSNQSSPNCSSAGSSLVAELVLFLTWVSSLCSPGQLCALFFCPPGGHRCRRWQNVLEQ